MKVLVTGVTGRVGANVARLLLDEGHDVRGFVMPGDTQRRKLALLPGIEEIIGDLGSQEDCSRAVSGVDIVIHLAAQLIRGQTPVDRLYDINAMSTLRLLEAAAHRDNINRFVLASTDGTYRPGQPPERPITEDSPQRPADYYGTSKLLGEVILHNHADQFGIDATIVRFATVVAPEEALRMFRREWIRSILRKAELGPDSNLWPLFRGQPDLVAALPGRNAAFDPPTTIFGPTGEPWSLHLVDVRDAARGVVLGAFHPGAVGDDFFIVGPSTTRFDEGALAVSRSGEKIEHVEMPVPWHLDIDGRKAQRALGFLAQYTFADTVSAGRNPGSTEAAIPARVE